MQDHGRLFSRDDIAALAFVLAGAVVVIILISSRSLRSERMAETCLVIATTVLLAGLIQVLTRVVSWLSEGQSRREFRMFFGSGNQASGYVADLIATHDLSGWDPITANGARPKGIGPVVPIEDLYAAIRMAQLFEQFGVKFTIENDSTMAVRDMPQKSFVAIGLGFNRLTTRLAEHTNLFNIVYADTYSDVAKDDFMFEGTHHAEPIGDRDYALIVRVPVPRGDHVVPGFVCAGRMPAGTAAAGEYLRNNWRRLYAHYQRDGRNLQDDVLAVELRHTSSVTSAQETRHSFAKVFEELRPTASHNGHN